MLFLGIAAFSCTRVLSFTPYHDRTSFESKHVRRLCLRNAMGQSGSSSRPADRAQQVKTLPPSTAGGLRDDAKYLRCPFDQDKCIFCRIAQGKETNELLHEDDSLVAFRDISPAAKEHILIISKAHIPSLFDLQATEADIQMVEQMVEIGDRLLSSAEPPLRRKFGFHYPPFNSVNHLHLHCLSPPLNWLGYKFVETPVPWAGYMTAEQLLRRLRVQLAGADSLPADHA